MDSSPVFFDTGTRVKVLIINCVVIQRLQLNFEFRTLWNLVLILHLSLGIGTVGRYKLQILKKDKQINYIALS